MKRETTFVLHFQEREVYGVDTLKGLIDHLYGDHVKAVLIRFYPDCSIKRVRVTIISDTPNATFMEDWKDYKNCDVTISNVLFY